MRLRPDKDQEPVTGRTESTCCTLGIAGLAEGTNVLTDGGWLPVEQVSEGDRVMTLVGGLLPVSSVRRRTFGTDIQIHWPQGLIYVPDGALGPAEAYYLLPGQQVMVREDIAASMFDDPETLIPAAALVGIRGITRVMPIDLVEVTELRFDAEAVVECQGGTWAKCPGVAARVNSVPRRRAFSQVGAA